MLAGPGEPAPRPGGDADQRLPGTHAASAHPAGASVQAVSQLHSRVVHPGAVLPLSQDGDPAGRWMGHPPAPEPCNPDVRPAASATPRLRDASVCDRGAGGCYRKKANPLPFCAAERGALPEQALSAPGQRVTGPRRASGSPVVGPGLCFHSSGPRWTPAGSCFPGRGG